MAEEMFDQSLFTDGAEAQAAMDLFNQGKAAAAKANPVGVFQAEITELSLGKSQSSGKLQIAYELTILVGPLAGTKLNKYDGLSKDTQVKMALESIKRLGVDTEKLTFDKLPAVLLSLKGTKVAIQCKQNGEFYNIYFQKAIKTVTPGTTAPAAAGKKF